MRPNFTRWISQRFLAAPRSRRGLGLDWGLAGFSRLSRLDHFIFLHILVGAFLGLWLDEATVAGWSWVEPFVEAVKRVVPAVDSFWRISPFPTVARLLPALLWVLALLCVPVALITVRHDFPLLHLPMASLKFLGYAGAALLIILAFALVPEVTAEHLENKRFSWPVIVFACRNQWFFGILGGGVSGCVAAVLAGFSLYVFRRAVARRSV